MKYKILNNINKENNKKNVFLNEINLLKDKLRHEDMGIDDLRDIINKEIKKFNEEINQKKIVLQDKLRNIDQYNASKDILTKLFESDEKNIVINYLKFPKGYSNVGRMRY